MSSIKEYLKAGASKLAESLASKAKAVFSKPQTYNVDGKIGKKGQPYRRYINYKQDGPWYLQTGLQPSGMPLMVRRYIHRFLHATKGWKAKLASKPTVTLSNMRRPRVYGPRAEAYIDHGRFVYPRKLAKNVLPGSAGAMLVASFKNAHKMPRREVDRAPLAA